MTPHYHRNGWLWWTAFYVLCGGGVLYWVVDQQAQDPADDKLATMIACGAILLAGVCVISATADWWLKR